MQGVKQRRYEAKKSNERAEVKLLPGVTWGQLREFVGPKKFDRTIDDIGVLDHSAFVDPVFMENRYSGPGGLLLFTSELFPASTSRFPYGSKQRQSIETCESVIRGGGVQQCLEPRGLGKSSRVARAALWSVLFGQRRCVVCFQSSAKKSRQTLDRIKNELAGNLAIRAMFPELVAACVHAKQNLFLQKKQHFGNVLTSIEWHVDSLRLPDIFDDEHAFPFCGSRVFTMAFSKGQGLSLSDPTTLQDLRPDLLLCDDVQSSDAAMGSPRDTEKLLDVWNTSLRYLGGRDKTVATMFLQTICSDFDMASVLASDPSVHTIRYGYFEQFADNDKWWRTTYRETLQGFDPRDPNGQAVARQKANQLYADNREMADAGAKVAWEYAYDPSQCLSAIQAGYDSLIDNEHSFWSQNQNQPLPPAEESDIRCKSAAVANKQHSEPRGVVPEFADRLVAHIDVHDSLLYYAVGCGNKDQQLAIVDYQTWPAQNVRSWTLENAPRKFDDVEELRSLPTVEDKIRVALNTLFEHLLASEYRKADGSQLLFESIGVDCGDHFDLIHAVIRDATHSAIIPMRGVAPGAAESKLNERPIRPNEKRRGDNWIEKKSDRSKVNWLQFDASYFKQRLHRGLSAPLGTSHSVSLFAAGAQTHSIIGDHVNNEKPSWVKAANKPTGCWTWKKLPGDNHFFDNCVGCYALLNRAGASFVDVQPFKKKQPRQKVTMAEVAMKNGWM